MDFTNTHKEYLALQLLNVVFYAYKAVPGFLLICIWDAV